MNKKIALWLPLILIVSIIGGFCMASSLFPLCTPKKSINSIINIYKKNYLELSKCCNEIEKYSDDIIIAKYDKTEGKEYKVSIYTNSNIREVKDDKLQIFSKYFFDKKKFVCINKESTFVYFTIRSGIDFEQGLAYSKNNIYPESNDMELKAVKKISEGWYYYEAE